MSVDIKFNNVITLQEDVFSNGKYFKHKEQYYYKDIVDRYVECPLHCTIPAHSQDPENAQSMEYWQKEAHYRIVLDGIDYFIPVSLAVKLNYLYPKEEIGIRNRIDYEENYHPKSFKDTAKEVLGKDITLSSKEIRNEAMIERLIGYSDYGNCDIKKGKTIKRKSEPVIPLGL